MRDRRELELPERTKPNLELSLDELETVSAGKGKSGGVTSSAKYLQMNLNTVLITSYQI